MKRSFSAALTAAWIISFGLAGCATKHGRTLTGLDDIAAQVEENRLKIDELQRSDREQNEKLSMLMDTVDEALARAKKAGRLAEGMFMYEVALNDDSVHFGFNKSDLSKEAKKALDDFALQLKTKNQDVYIEIQGHTDNVGSEAYNFELGLDRAEAALGYLHTQHGIPLHRMSTFSYGKSKPLVGNKTPALRAKNRRVSLIVIK
jgi:peptidoglycan-associated lipoprotein